MSTPDRTVATPWEICAVTLVCFGVFAARSVYAMCSGFPLVPFTDAGLVAMAFWEVVAAALALGFLRLRAFAIGVLLPRPTWIGCAVGIGLYFAAVLASAAAQAPFAADVTAQPIMAMLSDSRLSLPAIALVSVVNGAFEEIFLLGFLARGLRGYGLGVAVGAPCLVRVLCHVYQGPLGAMSVLGVGVVMAAFYLRTSRLWPPVLAHMLLDFVAFAVLRG